MLLLGITQSGTGSHTMVVHTPPVTYMEMSQLPGGMQTHMGQLLLVMQPRAHTVLTTPLVCDSLVPYNSYGYDSYSR
jgi:hypothetical protein